MVDAKVADAFATLLGWAPGLWRAVLIAALAFVLLTARRSSYGDDGCSRASCCTGLVLVAVAAVLGRIVDSQWSGIDGHLLSDWGFPELRLAGIAAVVTVTGPELVRPRACSEVGSSR